MNIPISFISIVFLLTIVEARYRSEHNEDETDERNEENYPEPSAPKHRRKRYHPSRGYSYLPPYHDRYYDREQDLVPDIWRLLDEISSYVKRPPAPQPIIIYPSVCPPCKCTEKGDVPSFPTRINDDMDPNRNWGLISEDDRGDNMEEDTPRPISFDPIKPIRGTRKPPPVDHGTIQAATSSPSTDTVPRQCDNAKVSCCFSKMNQRRCFANMNCSSVYVNGLACRPEEVQAALQRFIKTYSPDMLN